MTLFQKNFLDLTNRFGERPFLDDDRIGLYNIKESYELSLETAKMLSEAGLKPGDAIVIKATRSASFTILFYAAQILGVITLPIDEREDGKTMLGIDKRMKAVIYQEDEGNAILDWTIDFQDKKEHITIPTNPKGGFVFEGVDSDENADAVWVLTSGSEGHYKVVRHSQASLFSHCRRYAGPSSCDETDSGIVLLPLYHVFGLALIYVPIIVGFAIRFPASLDFDYIIEYINKKQITYLDHVPSFHYALAKRIQEKGVHFTSLRNGLTAGAPMEESRFREIEDILGMKLLPVYGASEIIGISALGQEASQERRRNTVGQVLEGTDIMILDENGSPVQKGEKGEIVVRSPSLMLGYLGEDSGIDEEGFFHTGDIGYLDEINDLHITGRKKQIIIRNGNNLSAVEIENRLLRVDGVISCSVVGIPSPSAGEVPAAMIAVKDEENVDEIREKIEADLPKNMWPEVIEFVSSLPLLPSGKVDRMKIKEALIGLA